MFRLHAGVDTGMRIGQSTTQTLASPLSPQDQHDPFEDPTMTNLKHQITDHAYVVDSGQVAEEILRKLRFVKWARRELVSAPGRTPRQKLRGP